MPRFDEYEGIDEAAKCLGICRNTLRNLGRQNKIPEHRHPVNYCQRRVPVFIAA